MSAPVSCRFLAWEPGDVTATWSRASTDDKQPDSVPRQEIVQEAFAKREGLPPIDPNLRFSVEGVSRDMVRGPDFDALLAAIVSPRVRVVLVETSSRIFADDQVVAKVRLAFQLTGTMLLDASTGRNLLPKEFAEKIVQAVEVASNENYVENLRKSIYAANRVKAERGAHLMGRAPFGIRKARDAAGNPIPRAFELDPDRIDALRSIFEWTAAGKSTWDVAVELTRLKVRGVPTKKFPGGITEWQRIQVSRLVQNVLFRGVWTWDVKKIARDYDEHGQKVKSWKTSPVEAQVRTRSPLGMTPLVGPHDCAEDGSTLEDLEDEDFARCEDCERGRKLWDLANEKLAEKSGERGPEWRKNDPRAFTGLVWCDRCGFKMSPFERPSPTGKSYFDFRCRSYRRRVGLVCSDQSHTVSELKLFRALSGTVKGKGKPGIVEFAPPKPRDERAALAALEASLGGIEKRLQQAKDDRTDGIFSREDFLAQKARLDAERADVEGRIAALEARKAQAPAEVKRVEADRRAAFALLEPTLRDESVPIEVRRKLAGDAIARIVVDNREDGLRIRFEWR